ncbi:recombination mediator RecR [Pelagibacteraceae bacterium]|jgi:recombination protein RecR|nr:recombination mediator RecR [Pelagibacteraceae bacterium]MDC0412670.1 recombination mediator RecR [Pelagibacteraceae bacterium]|tara:strand:+ start:88 stop:696 length:609 start_codon:yes stop_codon:yes gene_type:complete
MNFSTEPDLDELIALVSKLPGLGPKSSRRIALYLLKNRENVMKPLSKSLEKVHAKIARCNLCGNIKSKDNECICLLNKDFEQICVVENIADMWAMQSTSVYKGHYHILGGTLSALGNSSPEDLLINSLISRIKKNPIKEVILATSATIEGQTTAHYINDSIKDLAVKVTKLAHGLPVGGEIEYLDDGTLFSAFKFRSSLVSD